MNISANVNTSVVYGIAALMAFSVVFWAGSANAASTREALKQCEIALKDKLSLEKLNLKQRHVVRAEREDKLYRLWINLPEHRALCEYSSNPGIKTLEVNEGSWRKSRNRLDPRPIADP